MTFLKAGLAALALSASAVAMTGPALAQEAGIKVRSIRVLAADPEAAAVFYSKAFGMSETRRPANSATFKEIVLNSGSTPELAKRSTNTPIVIATKRNKDEKPVSMAALILEVPDMDKAIAAVVAAGGKGGTVNKSGEGLSYAFVTDPEGNQVELLLKQ